MVTIYYMKIESIIIYLINRKVVSYWVKKGDDFKTMVTKQEIELTADMIAT